MHFVKTSKWFDSSPIPMQVEPLSWNRMKEAGGQTGRGIWGLLQGESSMAGSGEPVRRNQVRAGLKDDSFDEQAGSCSASGIRPRSERDCSSQPLSLLCLREKIRAAGPRPTCSSGGALGSWSSGAPQAPLCSSGGPGQGLAHCLPTAATPPAGPSNPAALVPGPGLQGAPP